jgi:hypothetical protein
MTQLNLELTERVLGTNTAHYGAPLRVEPAANSPNRTEREVPQATSRDYYAVNGRLKDAALFEQRLRIIL